jgi:hypothetical protein
MGNPQAALEAAAKGGVVGAHEFLVAVAPRDYDRVAVIDVGRSLQKVVTAATRAPLTCDDAVQPAPMRPSSSEVRAEVGQSGQIVAVRVTPSTVQLRRHHPQPTPKSTRT